jgi:hypothetical protein
MSSTFSVLLSSNSSAASSTEALAPMSIDEIDQRSISSNYDEVVY